MNAPPAGLWRRLAAMVYDACLLVAVLFLAAVPPVLLNGGAIISDGSPTGTAKQIGFTLYLLVVAFVFHGGFWTHGGQTLGMTAWRIRIVSRDGGPLTWRQALIRWLTAGLGLANLTGLRTADRRGWHERLSRSRTVHLPKSDRV